MSLSKSSDRLSVCQDRGIVSIEAAVHQRENSFVVHVSLRGFGAKNVVVRETFISSSRGSRNFNLHPWIWS